MLRSNLDHLYADELPIVGNQQHVAAKQQSALMKDYGFMLIKRLN